MGGTRNNRMCAQRWNYGLRPELSKMKKGSWTLEEDDLLRQSVHKHGSTSKSWKLISADMKTRSSKQCRDHWTKYLNPNLRTGSWTKDEDERLLMLHRQYGNSYYKIKHYVSALGNRSGE